MGVLPFEHPFLSGLLGDEDVARHLSAEADLRAMLAFEAALAKAQAANGVIPADAAGRIAETCATFTPDLAALRSATARDGVVVPELVRQLRVAVGENAARHVHFGATSQDVIDTSLMMRLNSIVRIFSRCLSDILAALGALESRFGARRMMALTRMQAAFPIAVSDRLHAWTAPLAAHRDSLAEQAFPLQFGGAAGTLDSLGEKAAPVRAALAEALGLRDAPQWQSQRASIAGFAGLLSLVTGSLGKFGQDIALMAQAGDAIALSGGGSSSAMAHKQNPVAAETLVALARFNATQLSAIHQSIVHEQERSGAAWTLEWLVLPQMVLAAGASMRLAADLCARIERLGQ
ncbi:MAG TPA: 3-carboxy-cis,cis-muconate cycloisomerase [Sinorhizobium sp.]|nr:3-carboxy-cis,cis-muconate cycloisomerase [Sinorhizobium sp.]